MQNNVCSDIFWYGDILSHDWAKNDIKKKSIYKIRGQFWRHHQLTHLHIHNIDCSRNIRWQLRKFKISYLPYLFSLIYIKFPLFSVRHFLLFLLNLLKPGPDFFFNIGFPVHFRHSSFNFIKFQFNFVWRSLLRLNFKFNFVKLSFVFVFCQSNWKIQHSNSSIVTEIRLCR